MTTKKHLLLTSAATLCCLVVVTAGDSATVASDSENALSTADLFVDLARDRGLNCRGQQTPADVLHVKTLLRAALRLDPRQAQACTLLYELAVRGDQMEAAADLLERLASISPRNTTAFANWLDIGPATVQTVEQRKKWLDDLLRQETNLKNQALIHTHLARIALLQADAEQARTHLDQALQYWPGCPDAALLALQLIEPDQPPARRLAAILRALTANPTQVNLAWQAGLLLDHYGLHDQANLFFQHAVDVHRNAGGDGPLPPDKLLQLSHNALARGDNEQAVRYARQAAAAEQVSREAHIYLYQLLKDTNPAEPLHRQLATEFAAIKDPTEWPVGIISQAAWFHCIIDIQPQRALMLAENAATRAAADPFVTRVLGWSQALCGLSEDARNTLEPIAKTDPYAAYRLAKLLLEAGDETAARNVLDHLSYLPPVGLSRELIDDLGLPLPTTLPDTDRFSELVRLLSDFNWTLFDFHRTPANFLTAEIALENKNPTPGQPWWAIFSLTNRGSFPITLGPNWMVNPVFLLSVKTEGDRKRDYPGLLTISLDQTRVIDPGQSLRVRRTIDVGPLRKLSRKTPQHLQSITISAIVDPQHSPDGWLPDVTGQTLRSISFARLPANTDPEAWHARFSALKGDSPPDRFLALEVMAELLGEQQRAAAKPLAYKPQPIPAKRVQLALRSALESDSWQTRVHALDALNIAGLDRGTLDAANQCLEHPHWAVRLMAVRLLSRQGQTFAKTVQKISEQDDDELVRDMARGYLQLWSQKKQ